MIQGLSKPIWGKKLLKVENLSVSHGIIQAIYSVRFHIGQGECVALLGSNGAGKTTILNAISGVLPIMSGAVLFQGRHIEGTTASQRFAAGVIQVPEGGKIFPYMTVKENLIMGATGRDEAWAKREKTLKQVFKLFPILSERQNLQARLLSGGERQMFVMGRGLMAHPKILMIDEPSLGLAPKALLEVYRMMEIFRNEGITLLLSDQNVQQALQFAERAYVLENGRIALEGSSRELLKSDHIKTVYLGI